MLGLTVLAFQAISVNFVVMETPSIELQFNRAIMCCLKTTKLIRGFASKKNLSPEYFPREEW